MVYATGDHSTFLYVICFGIAIIVLGAFAWYKSRH